MGGSGKTVGVELLYQEYSAADQTGVTSTTGVDVTGLTGATPTVGSRPIEIEAKVAKMKMTAGTAPLFAGIALYEGATLIDVAYVQCAIAAGTSALCTPPLLYARRNPAAGNGTTYKVQVFVQSGGTWSILSTGVRSYIRIKEV